MSARPVPSADMEKAIELLSNPTDQAIVYLLFLVFCFGVISFFCVVGGAIGTAGAIATAPFRNDAYAYNDGYYGQPYYSGYDSGFVCQPGMVFRGEDGRRHICQ